MTTETLLALIAYAFVTSITPGPNNLMLLSSGVTYGFVRSIPHMLGIGLGFVLMVILVGLGVGSLLQSNPRFYLAMKVASLIYMLWLAWRIANSGSVSDNHVAADARPMTFLQAALFQWVNPKAWGMALTATAAFTIPEHFLSSLLMTAAVFGLVNIPSVGSWAAFGLALRGLFRNPRNVRVFNVVMALLLVASMAPVLMELAGLWQG